MPARRVLGVDRSKRTSIRFPGTLISVQFNHHKLTGHKKAVNICSVTRLLYHIKVSAYFLELLSTSRCFTHGSYPTSSLHSLSGLTFIWEAGSLGNIQFLRPPIYLQ